MRFHCSLRETSQILRQRRFEQRKAVSVHRAVSKSRMHRSSAKKHVYIYIYALTRVVPIYRSLLGRNTRHDVENALEKKEEGNPLCSSSRNDSRLRV
ncbi:hypothetical protein ALC53_05731 [Atta colombica]|uniref:Uncharacterized protein n=1 Tax=Atta colombica TaxID=520822 RepID=A0A195BGS2_9HYME|nr:hypothetical protein ALC53_05731 [Atta colombica]